MEKRENKPKEMQWKGKRKNRRAKLSKLRKKIIRTEMTEKIRVAEMIEGQIWDSDAGRRIKGLYIITKHAYKGKCFM